MNSPLINEWIQEVIKEEEEKAIIEATKKLVKKYINIGLTEKFDFVSKSLRDSIDSIDDIVVLEELFKKIVKIETLEDFKILLEKAKKI